MYALHHPELKKTKKIQKKLFLTYAFLMVTQLHWEDNVIWDGNDIKHKIEMIIIVLQIHIGVWVESGVHSHKVLDSDGSLFNIGTAARLAVYVSLRQADIRHIPLFPAPTNCGTEATVCYMDRPKIHFLGALLVRILIDFGVTPRTWTMRQLTSNYGMKMKSYGLGNIKYPNNNNNELPLFNKCIH
ncbi:hypothetical protein NQ317_014762 [Molorchus minor]|uniref:Uncharacterized protein n=1 Tax=Molorchus minor TaxID=1323400 RepID=A0ABQ9IYV7_9CUCU|nr:hypothetical protein NQ317_014762 [Molorchus minor]